MANIAIQPVQIWLNGQTITGNILEANSIYDNLVTESKFYYQIQNELQSLSNGNITITGDDYIIWQSNGFDTQWALNYICMKLNLTPIIPTTTNK
jgi:hypothetical protein